MSGCVRLCRAASFAPALFLAFLEGPEQLPSPGRGDLVIGYRRDTDARATQPEVCEDALAAFPTFGNTFHDPAPDFRRGSRCPRGAGFYTRGQGCHACIAASERALARMAAAALDGACDNQLRGDAAAPAKCQVMELEAREHPQERRGDGTSKNKFDHMDHEVKWRSRDIERSRG
jgi:hypothetical protein